MRIFKRDAGCDTGRGRDDAPRPGFHVRRLFRAGLFFLTGSALASCYGVVHAQSDLSPAVALIPGDAPVEIASGLSVPWTAVTIGDEVIVSQRGTAEIVAFRPGQSVRPVGIVPNFIARGDGGMLGLAVLREADAWLYIYHSTNNGNRVVRMRYSEGRLGDPQVVLDHIPGGRGHNGGRIAFGPDGMLYVTVGETRNLDLPQDLNSLAGKILRMTPDGGVPRDNPFPASLVYSSGHRNPQGLAWDDAGQLWATEFGDDTWDELNRIQPGGNYGWPIFEGRGDDPDYIDPVMQWGTQEMGPSGMAYIDGTFFIAGLTSQRIWTVTIDRDGVPQASDHLVGEYGRIRHVLRGSDGNLWFLTNSRAGENDRIYSVPLVSRP
ncbi:PQQ-dependent sugar dehydrogenase [Rhizobium bangladeshense]|uniref:PQQ-dependent sugar dehydrogenase n=1 Tax=Rhizobium bangladeshense TaxID=1138189 RepID=UPI001C82D23A|nr:PQQ-dependent sugar dehydrogenase [Rhizobium bangladeshense]MBX4898709.1 PQQ-dependent sugar dehydrogenase [Rhizobium bangladeshense]MBY3616732.1 PQQ-dependent sugar dehydrogenase [Rhizobium bangladeshense]